MDVRGRRRLNLDAPILSTKRHTGEEKVSHLNPQASDCASAIPFCWEDAPGMPKNQFLQRNDSVEDVTPRLKLPPARLSLQQPKPNFQEHDHYDDNDGDENISIYAFSDAIDVMSLTEAIDIAQKNQKTSRSEQDRLSNPKNTDHSDSNGYLTVESVEHNSGLSPNYIIERFLPDAVALAASSALAVSKKLNKNNVPYLCNYPDKTHVSRAVRESYDSPKGCGLRMLLPWRVRQRICGVRGSVTQTSQILVKHKSGAGGKKQ